jgi:hypothetical protein
MYMKLTADAEVESIKGELEFKSLMVEFGAFYRVGEFPVGGGRKLSLEVLAGGRYTYQKSQIRISGTGPLALRLSDGMSEDWFDPIVGGRVILNLTEKLNLIAKGDIGGFGVGSDFTWNAFGGIGYQFSLFGKDASIIAGYRALYQDYENGSGSNKFAYDATMQGPLFGLRIRF